MTELNPNHAVTRLVRENWNKIAAVLVHKNGGHVVISSEDLAGMPDLYMTVQELKDGLHLTLVDLQTAKRLAREHGGLPI